MPGTWVLQEAGRGHGAPIYLNIRMPFDGQAPDVPGDNPTAVYRRTFRLPAGWRRRRTHLRVGAADSMGVVWVNGCFVGAGTDSKLASTYDITDALRAGANDVTIAVPRWSAATWLEDQDQWWLPGLHRSVELVSVPHVALADIALVPGLAPDGVTGLLDVDVTVDGEAAATVEVTVRARGGRNRLVHASGPMPVALWDPAGPFEEHRDAYLWPGSAYSPGSPSRRSRRGTTRPRRCTGHGRAPRCSAATCSTCARASSGSGGSRSPTASCS